MAELPPRPGLGRMKRYQAFALDRSYRKIVAARHSPNRVEMERRPGGNGWKADIGVVACVRLPAGQSFRRRIARAQRGL